MLITWWVLLLLLLINLVVVLFLALVLVVLARLGGIPLWVAEFLSSDVSSSTSGP